MLRLFDQNHVMGYGAASAGAIDRGGQGSLQDRRAHVGTLSQEPEHGTIARQPLSC